MNANPDFNPDTAVARDSAATRDSAAACDMDHTINRGLSALRDAAPRPGLEGRVLASLEHHTAPHRSRFHISARLALCTATSAAVLAIASLLILHHHTDRTEFATAATAPQSASTRPQHAVILSGTSPRDAQSKDPDNTRLATNSAPLSTTNRAQTTHTLSSRPEHRSLAAMRSGETCISNRLASGCPIHDDNVVMGGVVQTPTDTQALADLHAPSHPAPPLPLTPQEKVLLRVAHHGNTTQLVELAALNPEVNATRDAQNAAAFHAFFPDPPPTPKPDGDAE